MTRHRLRLEDNREQPRVKLPAMYTLLRIREPGEKRYRWAGHIYDISLAGLRFEIDTTLIPGTRVEIRAMLPGRDHINFRAAGQIVRIHDDAAGPTRMAMDIQSFYRQADHDRLRDYLHQQTHMQVKAPIEQRKAA